MTIFKKIIERELPADIVYEDEHVLAFRDIHPQAPVHVLFIPKMEVKDFLEAGRVPGLMDRMYQAIHTFCDQADLDRENIRLVTNCGARAGQSVFHFHLHLLSGRSFDWPPG